MKDLEPGIAGSDPAIFTHFQGRAYFRAVTAAEGSDLWTSDGTSAGTSCFDLEPGPDSSGPGNFLVIGGTLYFTAATAAAGNELWMTDGTLAGTTLVKDIRPGAASSQPRSLCELGGILYFVADDGAHGNEIWSSDGTSAGTVLVCDVALGTASSASTLTVGGGRLHFVYDNGIHGSEPWVSNGTCAGTAMLADLAPGSAGSFVVPWIELSGKLIFRAISPPTGAELWTTNGTAAGTTLFADINPGAGSSAPTMLAELAGTIYFQANDGSNGPSLWKTDGTSAGTSLVADIRPGTASPDMRRMIAHEGRVYFDANDGTHGAELWTSDGTSDGTLLVADIRPGSAGALAEEPDSNFPPFASCGGKLYFAANDGSHGNELWRSTGSATGTQLVLDLRSGPTGSLPIELRSIGSTLYFSASEPTSGREPRVRESSHATFCHADGTSPGFVACPCANIGAAEHGCANSQSPGGAILFGVGLPAPDALVLSASDMLASSTAVFLQGTSALTNGVVFGDGVRCVGGLLKLISVEHVSGGSASYPLPGDPSISAVSASLGNPIAPGSSRYYQVYYRDPALAFCPAPPGNSWNITNAVTVAW